MAFEVEVLEYYPCDCGDPMHAIQRLRYKIDDEVYDNWYFWTGHYALFSPRIKFVDNLDHLIDRLITLFTGKTEIEVLKIFENEDDLLLRFIQVVKKRFPNAYIGADEILPLKFVVIPNYKLSFKQRLHFFFTGEFTIDFMLMENEDA